MSDAPIRADLHYPRQGGPQSVIVGLEDVRAADNLHVSFDFDRNGWRLGMDRVREVDGRIETIAENVEVGFLPAWNEEEP